MHRFNIVNRIRARCIGNRLTIHKTVAAIHLTAGRNHFQIEIIHQRNHCCR
jgi:hypothetical protein